MSDNTLPTDESDLPVGDQPEVDDQPDSSDFADELEELVDDIDRDSQEKSAAVGDGDRSSDDADEHTDSIRVQDVHDRITDSDAQPFPVPLSAHSLDRTTQQIAESLEHSDPSGGITPPVPLTGAQLGPLPSQEEPPRNATTRFAPLPTEQAPDDIFSEEDADLDAERDAHAKKFAAEAKRWKIISTALALVGVLLFCVLGGIWYQSVESKEDTNRQIQDLSGQNGDLSAQLDGTKRRLKRQISAREKAEQNAANQSRRADQATQNMNTANAAKTAAEDRRKKADARADAAEKESRDARQRAADDIAATKSMAAVPNVVGLTRAEAQRVFDAMGFTTISWRLKADDSETAVVDSVSPGVGQVIKKTDPISVR